MTDTRTENLSRLRAMVEPHVKTDPACATLEAALIAESIDWPEVARAALDIPALHPEALTSLSLIGAQLARGERACPALMSIFRRRVFKHHNARL